MSVHRQRHFPTACRQIQSQLASVCIGADFLQAMLATAPGQKLLTGRHPAATFFFASLFFCRKLHFFLGKSTKKLLPPGLHFLTQYAPNCLSLAGFAQTQLGQLTVLPRPPSCIQQAYSKGRERRKGEGVALRRKKMSVPMSVWVKNVLACSERLQIHRSRVGIRIVTWSV